MSRIDTFEHINKWVKEIYSQTDIKNPTIMVLGNKRDLDKKEISSEQIENFMREHRDILFYEVSSRTGF